MTSLADAMAACARQTALEQRARLLDAVWDDVQGERRAIRHGVLPERLLTNAARSQGGLRHFAADLLYCPDGVWRVSRDHVGQHPGAGLLEAPILAVFLPGLCRLLLGETLRLPSLPVWWLGEPHIWPLLAANSRQFCIRNGFDPESRPVILSELPAGRRQWLQAMVDADPCGFVAGLNLGWLSPIQRVTYDTGRGEMETYCRSRL